MKALAGGLTFFNIATVSAVILGLFAKDLGLTAFFVDLNSGL